MHRRCGSERRNKPTYEVGQEPCAGESEQQGLLCFLRMWAIASRIGQMGWTNREQLDIQDIVFFVEPRPRPPLAHMHGSGCGRPSALSFARLLRGRTKATWEVAPSLIPLIGSSGPFPLEVAWSRCSELLARSVSSISRASLSMLVLGSLRCCEPRRLSESSRSRSLGTGSGLT